MIIKHPCGVSLALLLLIFPGVLFAQFPFNPERMASGNGILFQHSVWSGGFGNMAAADTTLRFSAGVYNARSFLVPELNERGVTVNVRMSSAALFSGAYALKGYTLFKKYYCAFAMSRSFGTSFTSGLRIEIHGITQGEHYGSAKYMRCSGGTMVRLSKVLDAATVFSIPIREGEEINHMDFAVGTCMRFSELFRVSAEASLTSGRFSCNSAFQYKVHKRVTLQGGVDVVNRNLGFGFKMDLDHITIHVAAMHKAILGFSPAAGLSSGIL